MFSDNEIVFLIEEGDELLETAESLCGDDLIFIHNDLDAESEEENVLTGEIPSTSCSDSKQPVFNWKVDAFHPRIYPFDDENSGAQLNIASDAREIDYFKMFFNSEIIDIIVTETNRQYIYATKHLSHISERLRRWRDTSADEMYTFLALSMLMTRNLKNAINEHWSTKKNFHFGIYSETMSRNRFQILQRMLHFSDNEKQVPGDRLFKVRTIFSKIMNNFRQNYFPHQNVCIDESLVLFKGRLSFRQHISSKTNRLGIKLFMLCDCTSGYILNCIVYTGLTTEVNVCKHLGMAGSIVMTLLEPYLNRGHSLYIDNWYSSPILFDNLHRMKTNACGMVKKNRFGMPKLSVKLEEGEASSSHTEIMMALYWRHKKDITMLSTLHSNEIITTEKHDFHTDRPTTKPTVVADYDKNKGGIDKCNQMMHSANSMRKSRWYKKFFFHLLDLSLHNSHIIYMEKHKKISLNDFQSNLIEQLLEEHSSPKQIQHKIKSSQGLERLTERHFLSSIPSIGKKKVVRRCYVCGNSKKKPRVRKETRYKCKQCDIAMCLEPCFEIYHTELLY